MKTKPNIDRLKRYDSYLDFFELDGSVVMRLTKSAAIEICERGVSHGRVVARIEGGLWLDPYFEARGDCIWDGVSPPASAQVAEQNNIAARSFILEAAEDVDVFIITAPPMTGWP